MTIEILETWDGPLYWNERDKYYADGDDAFSSIINDAETEAEIPELLFCCSKNYPKMGSEQLVDMLLDQLADEYSADGDGFHDYIDDEMTAKLVALVDEIKPRADEILKAAGWALWEPNMKQALNLKAELVDAWKDENSDRADNALMKLD